MSRPPRPRTRTGRRVRPQQRAGARAPRGAVRRRRSPTETFHDGACWSCPPLSRPDMFACALRMEGLFLSCIIVCRVNQNNTPTTGRLTTPGRKARWWRPSRTGGGPPPRSWRTRAATAPCSFAGLTDRRRSSSIATPCATRRGESVVVASEIRGRCWQSKMKKNDEG